MEGLIRCGAAKRCRVNPLIRMYHFKTLANGGEKAHTVFATLPYLSALLLLTAQSYDLSLT
jgi:hypothetical protein